MTKRILTAFAALALVLGLVPAAALAGEAKGDTVSTFAVKGMTCGGCEVGVRTSVKKLDGVEDVKVSHTDAVATVKYESAKVTPDQIVEAIKKAGFEAKLEKTEKA
jgi:copper chaperone CopZ